MCTTYFNKKEQTTLGLHCSVLLSLSCQIDEFFVSSLKNVVSCFIICNYNVKNTEVSQSSVI